MPITIGNPCIAISRPDKRINKFIQGGVINSFAMPKELTRIAPHAFDNIGGLQEIVFTNQDVVVDVSANAGIAASVKFVVPEQLYDGYVAKYPERTIVSYETGYEWTIPYVEGETSTTLTAAYVNQCLAQNPDAKKAGKVIVPSYFISAEEGCCDNLASTITNLKEYDVGTISIKPDKFDVGIRTQSYGVKTWKGGIGKYGSGSLIKISWNAPNSSMDMTWFSIPLIEEAYVNVRELEAFTITMPAIKRLIFSQNFNSFKRYERTNYFSGISENAKIYFEKTNGIVTYNNNGYTLDSNSLQGKAYVPADLLVAYITSAYWQNVMAQPHGYLDYDGTNIPTFSGYVDAWYGDEDCLISTTTDQFVSGNRYFVKLTAI